MNLADTLDVTTWRERFEAYRAGVKVAPGHEDLTQAAIWISQHRIQGILEDGVRTPPGEVRLYEPDEGLTPELALVLRNTEPRTDGQLPLGDDETNVEVKSWYLPLHRLDVFLVRYHEHYGLVFLRRKAS